MLYEPSLVSHVLSCWEYNLWWQPVERAIVSIEISNQSALWPMRLLSSCFKDVLSRLLHANSAINVQEIAESQKKLTYIRGEGTIMAACSLLCAQSILKMTMRTSRITSQGLILSTILTCTYLYLQITFALLLPCSGWKAGFCMQFFP